MRDGLSRRELMVLGAGGVVLTGAHAPCETEPKARYGRWPTHGELPGNSPAYCNGADEPDFRPDYLTLIHIDFVRRWTIKINHACFYYPRANAGQRFQRAIELFGLKRPASGRKQRFSDLPDTHKPVMRHGRRDFDDFTKFGFASQHEIFFLFDDPNVLLDETWLVSFAPGSDTGQWRDPNYSFFRARAEPAWLHGGTTNAGWIVRIENYFTNPEGRPLDPHLLLRYSMNLHFKIDSPTGHIPIILDPDTGNGAGHEP